MKLKLKYYLRGLGLGIVVMAVIMCIRESKDNKMTDEEIMARAKQLGMIESTVLIDTSSGEDNDAQGTDTDQPEDNLESGDDEGQSQTDGGVTGTEVQANANVSDPDEQPNTLPLLPDAWANTGTDKQDTQDETEMAEGSVQDTQSDADMTETGTQETLTTTSEFPKVIIISNGESSYTVSKRLAEIGAVESASDFDTYLCEHGYDKKIRAGTYTIPVGATDEQMAKIVTGSKVTE
ncbi:MAG: endolytic transglycosylase MltG [Lachnospiraceae bacterium]|nr:endolytic transglycosylase MltG [Lachnospiraceae bacterium]